MQRTLYYFQWCLGSTENIKVIEMVMSQINTIHNYRYNPLSQRKDKVPLGLNWSVSILFYLFFISCRSSCCAAVFYCRCLFVFLLLMMMFLSCSKSQRASEWKVWWSEDNSIWNFVSDIVGNRYRKRCPDFRAIGSDRLRREPSFFSFTWDSDLV